MYSNGTDISVGAEDGAADGAAEDADPDMMDTRAQE